MKPKITIKAKYLEFSSGYKVFYDASIESLSVPDRSKGSKQAFEYWIIGQYVAKTHYNGNYWQFIQDYDVISVYTQIKSIKNSDLSVAAKRWYKTNLRS
jgi:hypothetical protein